MPKKDQEPREPAERPPAYPLDEILEQAYAPDHSEDIPRIGHTDDREYRDGAKETTGEYPRDEHTGENAPAQTAGEVTAAKAASENGDQESGDHEGGNDGAEDHAPMDVCEGNALGLVTNGSVPVPLDDASAREIAPETLQQSLQGLPQWQARYVLELMDLGGVIALACRRCNVSRDSVQKAQEASPAFRHACSQAVHHSTDLVEGAIFRGATLGDLEPIYQGGICVGYKRRRNTKDAELLLRLRGRLQESAQQTTSTVNVTVEALPAMMAGVMDRLYAANKGRPVIEAEVVEQDKGAK